MILRAIANRNRPATIETHDLGNEFTAADIQFSFPIELAVARGGLDTSRPKLINFLDRIHTRPAYQRASERGGAYKVAS